MQTPGRRSHHSWPALYCAVLLTAGIAPAYRWSGLPALPLWVPIALFVLFCAAVLLALRSRITAPLIPSFLLIVCVPACGVVLGWEAGSAQSSIPDSVTASPVRVAGEIADQPVRNGNRIRCRFHVVAVAADSVTLTPDWMLTASLPIPDPEAGHIPAFGDALVLLGNIQRPRGPRNPGEFDESGYYRANGLDGILMVRKGDHVRPLTRADAWSWMRDVVIPLREGLRSHINTTIGGEEGEFLKGLMIGDRGGLAPSTRDAFMVAGVAHILAVSGGNVAVVSAALVVLLLLLRIPRSLFPLPLSVGLILYMLISGTQPSVVRATIMAFIMLVASSGGWRGNGLNALGLAALVMYAMDVRQLFDAGFTLSFGAVLSILLLYPGLDAIIGRWKSSTLPARWLRGALQLAAVSAASSIGTLPLTAVQFGRVSVVGLIANIPVVPVTGWSVVLGLCSAGMGSFVPWAGEALGAVNFVFLRGTLWFVGMCASLPGASLDMYWFDPVYAIPLLATLGTWYHRKDPAERNFWAIGALAAMCFVLWLPRDTDHTRELLRISFIDVGQGDAALLEHPGGGALLIDTGPVPVDTRSGIVPFLLRRGIHALDAVIITHAHDDHAGGLRSVCSTFTVGRVLTGAQCRPGDTIMWKSDCRLQVLSGRVTTDSVLLSQMNANRTSIVVRLVYGRTAFVFAADAEEPEEDRMVGAFGSGLRSAVLKVGHHGSAAGTSDAWLDAVAPSLAVISVGRLNKFGHPARRTIARLEQHGVHICRTDLDGAVVMTSDGDTTRVLDWR